jgi:PII-like signaling protein
VRAPATKLTVYFSERTRTGEGFLADALLELYGRHRIHTSVLLRGADGFGVHHRLHTDRLLSASENLPAVSIAVDTRERIDAALPDVQALASGAGLITLEHALLLTDADLERIAPPAEPASALKLTLYGGRRTRVDGQAGYVAAVDRLAADGASGASVLLAVDGTLHGERRRARFFARNADVPLMVIAVGNPDRVAAALPELAGMLDTPVATVERVQVCRAAGQRVSEPATVASHDRGGGPIRQKLTVHVEEGARHAGHPVHSALLQGLRRAGLAGVTTLRGVRGFYAEREPFADRALSLRRRVPLLLVAIDSPERIQSHWSLVDELTREHGLVTSEVVPVSFTAQ